MVAAVMLTELGLKRMAAVNELYDYCLTKAEELVKVRINKGVAGSTYDDKRLIGLISGQMFDMLTKQNLVEELSDGDNSTRDGSRHPVHAPCGHSEPASSPSPNAHQMYGQAHLADDY
jgi:hypothetical protein